MDTNTILDLYGNTVFGITGSKNRPATQPLFMGLIKCFDDRRSVRLWLMIPVVSMNKNPEIKTHAYMQVVMIFQILFLSNSGHPYKTAMRISDYHDLSTYRQVTLQLALRVYAFTQ
jgi:hypothetical protein